MSFSRGRGAINRAVLAGEPSQPTRADLWERPLLEYVTFGSIVYSPTL